jgi:hypothetical protein
MTTVASAGNPPRNDDAGFLASTGSSFHVEVLEPITGESWPAKEQ